MNKASQEGFTGFDDLTGVDPAVDSLLGQGQRRQVESHLPQKERSRKKKERERAQKRIPGRIGLDLPVELKHHLNALAQKEGVPVSQLVAFLLYEPVYLLEHKRTSLWGYKTPSTSPKFDSNLDLKRKAEDVSRNG